MVADRFEYRFEWDPVKATRNARKHGVTFEQAATVFLDARLLSQIDEEHNDDEERWVSLGLDRSARLLVVCHTYRHESEHGATIPSGFSRPGRPSGTKRGTTNNETTVRLLDGEAR